MDARDGAKEQAIACLGEVDASTGDDGAVCGAESGDDDDDGDGSLASGADEAVGDEGRDGGSGGHLREGDDPDVGGVDGDVERDEHDGAGDVDARKSAVGIADFASDGAGIGPAVVGPE